MTTYMDWESTKYAIKLEELYKTLLQQLELELGCKKL